MISEYSLIPPEAFLYFPEHSKTIEYVNNKKQRIIFSGNIDFDEQEKQKISQIRLKIRSNPKNHYCDDYSDDFLLRSYQAAQYKIDDTIKCLKEYYQWQKKTLPLILTSRIEQLLKRGIMYVSGRDCFFRPIIIVNAKKILDLKINQQDLTVCLSFFFQYIIENLFIEGQIQQWSIIIDLGNASIFSLGKSMLDIIVHLSSIFKVRAVRNFLISCPSSVKILWSALKNALNQDQIRKISMSEKKQLKEADFQFINRNQVEEKYGGTYPNIQQYWPLHLNPYPVYVESINTKAEMISQEQYDNLFNQGKLKDRKIKKNYIIKYQSFSNMKNMIPDTVTERDERSQNQNSHDEDMTNFDNNNLPIQSKPIPYEAITCTPISFHDLF